MVDILTICGDLGNDLLLGVPKNVLLVKIEAPVTGIPSISIYDHLTVVERVNKPFYESTDQWESGTSMEGTSSSNVSQL